ncbi:MAG: hypothetical protein A2W31_18610 [Planctomycetes bacterium RBG_16_64_10]|nr:MAG: hypothetical protein A2W31_18610 [Planctomycetes bacterium RBG_16_64_10]
MLVDRKKPARSPPLDEVEDRVRADYLARKQQELAAALFDELTARYQVKILTPDPGTDKDTDTDTSTPASKE